ncbi:MAG: GH32 C-terminal domain-containing protein [Planctomycetota bacterium]
MFALDDVAYTRYSLGPGRAAPNVVNAPFELKKGEPLRLRVFLDKPMLEVFANDRQAIAQQVFPKRKDSLLIKAFAKEQRHLFNAIAPITLLRCL